LQLLGISRDYSGSAAVRLQGLGPVPGPHVPA
jgi:hypothetical protein